MSPLTRQECLPLNTPVNTKSSIREGILSWEERGRQAMSNSIYNPLATETAASVRLAGRKPPWPLFCALKVAGGPMPRPDRDRSSWAILDGKWRQVSTIAKGRQIMSKASSKTALETAATTPATPVSQDIGIILKARQRAIRSLGTLPPRSPMEPGSTMGGSRQGQDHQVGSTTGR